MARNNRGGRNNNPEGRNQYSSSWVETARDKPFTAAATAAAAVGAGVFLWSRRNQISEQLSHLSDQISDWSENMRSGSEGEGEGEFEMAGAGDFASSAQGTTGFGGSASGKRAKAGSARSTSARSGRRGMSETGGGNASLGAHGGTTGSGAGEL